MRSRLRIRNAALVAWTLGVAPVMVAHAEPPVAAESAPSGADSVVVHLTDGGAYRGTLLSEQPGVAVVIRTATGKERRFEMADVERVERLASSPAPAPKAAPPPAPVQAAPAPAPAPVQAAPAPARPVAGAPIWKPVGAGRTKAPPVAAQPTPAPVAAPAPTPVVAQPEAPAPAPAPVGAQPEAPAPAPAPVAAPPPAPVVAQPAAPAPAPAPVVAQPEAPAPAPAPPPAPPPAPAPAPVAAPLPPIARPAAAVTPTAPAPVAAPLPPIARPAAAVTPAAPAPVAAPVSWPSMARAKEARPLPRTSPMTSELMPLPPPPGFGRPPSGSAERQQAAGSFSEPPPTALPAPEPAPVEATAAGAEAAPDWKAPGAKKRGKAPAAQKAPAIAVRGATVAPAPAPTVAPAPNAPSFEAPPPLPPDGGGAADPAKPKEGEWSYDVDKTGITVGFEETLESDSVRKSWAEKGGSLSGSEVGLGVSFMFLSKDIGYGLMTMSGTGFQASLGLLNLSMTPPDYETRGTKWTAWKTGIGVDVASFSFTNEFTSSSSYISSFSSTGSMTQLTLNGCIGFLTATGSFDSETEWSGFAIGVDWVPSIVKTTTTVGGSSTSSEPTFNATGFALNFESGSMSAMAETMAKEAKFKLRVFLLPPVGDLPLFMSINVGWVWY